jgi:N-acetylneuraminic acid mutarotase
MTGLLIGAFIGAGVLNEEGSQTPIPSVATPVQDQSLGDSNWLRTTAMPSGRTGMALAAVGLELYAIGGEVEAGVINLVDVFETSTRQWHSAAPKPTAVAGASAAVLFGEVYVPGGLLSDARPTAVVEAYSPANDAWRPVAPLPFPLAGALALSDGNRLYVIGGWDGERFRDSTLAYDPASDAWSQLAPLATARAYPAGGVVNGGIMVAGGEAGDGPIAECEVYEPAADAWSACAPLSVARSRAGGAVVANVLYVLGGETPGDAAHGEFLQASGGWKEVSIPMVGEGADLSAPGVTAVETRIYLMGGRQGGQIQDGNYAYLALDYRTFLPTVGGD